ncbi:D-sedoheptulose-7-phosphate isomerase [Parabacteroides gordonii]|jgi:D-sedoheptulose 7-phosphate isomerase|uniref:Phosphoheptose isomerase n=1 Tax=Parabacteroides gordonii MS-1 = DSM 23371 TaxID=1203610 RepID=A0A0F5JLQ1_9BACT|nr:SIS domain-containing protein [Parabacteroides gordonii]KKB58698.1 phosphoheptose isomerase [Parabacteroides gordonii MS-1 = DSM 23371]MCA5583040.1 SIS domain-containing protein [Parabacteroides gordonii]MCD8136869.1 SIS domain-containing protein [Parabacteroides gordonii]RGP17354.1 SIS domain-containing protein [Parabacteroides gordonii]
MDSKGIIRKRLEQHRDVIEQILSDEKLQDMIAQITETIVTCFKYGGRVYFCGNGGSAADAQHLAAEFSGKFYLERDILPSEALHCNSSYITAVSNDLSFEIIYSRLISGIGKAGDVLIGLSTSGNSANIVKAFETCHEKAITTVAFTGSDGGRMRELSKLIINVPSTDTPRIQEAHITIGHIICELVEEEIFGKKK